VYRHVEKAAARSRTFPRGGTGAKLKASARRTPVAGGVISGAPSGVERAARAEMAGPPRPGRRRIRDRRERAGGRRANRPRSSRSRGRREFFFRSGLHAVIAGGQVPLVTKRGADVGGDDFHSGRPPVPGSHLEAPGAGRSVIEIGDRALCSSKTAAWQFTRASAFDWIGGTPKRLHRELFRQLRSNFHRGVRAGGKA